MPEEDFYNTIQREATAEYKDRDSRFIAFACLTEDSPMAKTKLQGIKKEHPKASHHCFAYRIGLDGNNFRVSDDGEPSGTAGKPILGQIDSKQLTNVMIVIARYFGGTLLGVPGLINAYKTAASLVLQLTPIVRRPILISYRLLFDYTLLNEVMTVIKNYNCIIQTQQQSMFCNLQIGIPKAQQDKVIQHLEAVYGLEIVRL